MIVELIRMENSVEFGTFGVLKIDKKLFCVTLERPNLQNKTSISCIPTGQYICKGYHSERFGETWQVMNVPDRTYILFHGGNKKDDCKGCIMLGETVRTINGTRMIVTSKKTVARFLKLTGKIDEFTLTITECF